MIKEIAIKQNLSPVEDKIPIFIIGAGGIVRDAHLPAYRKAGFVVNGICDLEEKKAEALVKSFPEIRSVYDSLETFMLAHGNKRVVFDIAVPASQVVEILEKLPDGVPVLIQKPMGETLDEARSILELCSRKALAAEVNFQLKYAPFSIAAKSLIEQGAIGDIYDIEIMVCVYTPWHLWDFLKDKPRVEILYHSIHYIDLVRSFLGNPQKIYASTVKHPKTKDLASSRTTMILDYDPFTQARIITNHGHDFGLQEQKSYLKIEGTKGAIQVQIGVSLNYPKGKPDRLSFIGEQTHGQWREVELHGSWFPDAFIGPMNHVQHFYRENDKDRLETIRDNFETMRVVEAAYRSSEAGGLALSDIQ